MMTQRFYNPEWSWFWDGTIKYLWTYKNSRAREEIHNILPNAGSTNITPIATSALRSRLGVRHSNKVDFDVTEIGSLFTGSSGFTVITYANAVKVGVRESLSTRRVTNNDLHIELRAGATRDGTFAEGALAFIVSNSGNGGTAGGADTPTTTGVDGDWHVFIGRRENSGGCSIWRDGIDRTNESISTTDDFTGAVDFALGGLSNSTSIPYTGDKLLDIWVDRAWSDYEIRKFSNDPDGPFRPRRRVSWLPSTAVVFTSANLTLAHSGASDIGGAIGAALTDDALNNIWDDVSSADADAGDTEFRCTYVKNTHSSLSVANVKVEIDTDPTESNWEIALGAAGKNGTETEVANENTAPATPVFGTTALSLGTLAAGDHFPIWIKRIVTAGAGAATPDTGILRILGDDPN